MTEDEKRIRQLIQLALLRLHIEEGLDLAKVLAFAHAEVLTLVTAAYGGQVARDCLIRAARQVEDVPALDSSPLALAAPQGRA